MELKYDAEADAAYIRLRHAPYAFGHNLDYDRRIDFGADEKPIGIELLGISHGVNVDGLPDLATVERLLLSHNIKVYSHS
jgi:uncharacterized protein YuzE